MSTHDLLNHAATIAATWTRSGPSGRVSDADLVRAVFVDDTQLEAALLGDTQAHRSYTEVADELGMSRQNLTQRAHKLKMRLRYHMGEALPHPNQATT